MIELLIVLAIIAICAAIVLPGLISPTSVTQVEDASEFSGTDSNGVQSATIPNAAIDRVLVTARQLAIKRGEPVRVRIAEDGVWAVVSVRDGAAIENGRLPESPSWQPDVTIDAMGACVISPTVAPPDGARAWDVLRCQWRGASP